MMDIVSVVIPVYQDWARAERLVNALAQQTLPADTTLDMVVVDDGSHEPAPTTLCDTPRVALLVLPENRGRASARNAGFAVAKGRIVLFMDCDCLPGGADCLMGHVNAIDGGAVASTGHVHGTTAGFWDRYQQRTSWRRESRHRAGFPWTGSSQNLAVLANAFHDVGGFDTRYREYGFEDRDLLVRLGEVGAIAWSSGAPVLHTDALRLDAVARKMIEGARFSAPRFARDHPHAYRVLGYARWDAQAYPWLRLPARLVGPLALALARRLDRLLPRLPFRLAAAIVAGISAMSFLYGSATRPT